MKLWAAVVGAVGVGGALLPQPKPPQTWTVVIGGNVAGYLSPCGCTYPMSGGIRRWATEVQARIARGQTLVLENGGMVTGTAAQDRLKAEALAETLGRAKVAAINLTPDEAQLGKGELSQLAQLANASLVSTQLQPNREIGVSRFVTHGPFLIGGATEHSGALASVGESKGEPLSVAREIVATAKVDRLVPILMLAGDEQSATEIARQVPDLRLIVFDRSGDPPYRATTVGKTVLVTPGEHGKFLVQLSFAHGEFGGYATEDLGPSVKDDPSVSKIYSYYLRNVDSEKLIDAYPRQATAAFAGSTTCGSCHAEAYEKWKSTKHSGSYVDLRAQGHGADPDCVSCHVTGLGSDHGFRNLALTPDLAAVGCESCHGPGAAHAANPNVVKMQKVGTEFCSSCHDPENSPHFDALTYWKQIEHH